MKAIRVSQFGEPEVLQLEPVDERLPTTDQLLIKIKAIGVNPVDIYIRSSQSFHIRPDLMLPA